MSNKSKSELRKFVAPEVLFGVGALDLVGTNAKKLGGKKVLIVSDSGVIKAGWMDRVVNSLLNSGLEFVVFSEITPNPKDYEVMAGAKFYKDNECDLIVVVGGGSPMDCAKGIGIISSNSGHILDYEGVDRVSIPMPPIICIPTTGGTSADVSQFAIINAIERQTKIAIISKAIVPDISLIDPQTLTTMDSHLTACTGLDALVHSIEAFVSNAYSHITNLHALDAIRLIVNNLKLCIENPMDLDLRANLMIGSMEAGFAFSNASLGLVHAMAHSLGGFRDLPHGECNAILLPHVIDYNFSAVPEKFIEIAKAFNLNVNGLSDLKVKQNLIDAINKLRDDVGVKSSIGLDGIKLSDISELSERALADPCVVTNPRDVTQRDIEVIYEQAI